MNKPLVVLAETDAAYLIPLEDTVTEALSEQADIEVITDPGYFRTYFSSPKRIDSLIVSDALYSGDLHRHSITNIFLLTEEPNDPNPVPDNVTKIFKYSSTKEIFDQILYKNRELNVSQVRSRATQVIAVTSAAGGSGKTAVSMALALRLVKNHKHVLFISTDPMQGFSFFVTNQAPLPNDVFKAFSGDDAGLYTELRPYIRHEEINYIPPFPRDIHTYGFDFDIYNRMIAAIRATTDYDYIIVDMDMQLDEHRAALIRDADKVVLLVMQDKLTARKTSYLTQNLDCRDSEKFVFVCNRFKRDAVNYFMDSEAGHQFLITEYIEELQPFQTDTPEAFSEAAGIRNLAFLFG